MSTRSILGVVCTALVWISTFVSAEYAGLAQSVGGSLPFILEGSLPFTAVPGTTGQAHTLRLASDGSVYLLATITSGNLAIFRSVDGGVTWSSPNDLLSKSHAAANYQLHIDKSNIIHVAWWITGSIIGYTRSNDGGTTFSTPLKVPTTYASASGYQIGPLPRLGIAADGNGNVYILYYAETHDSLNNLADSDLWVSRSTNGGVSFLPEIRATQLSPSKAPAIPIGLSSWGLGFLTADGTSRDLYFSNLYFSTNSVVSTRVHSPSGTVNSSGDWVGRGSTVYVIYSDSAVDPTGDITLCRSVDNGNSFPSCVKVNGNSAGPQIEPAVELESNGNLHAVWADRGFGATYHVRYARSINNGVSFEPDIDLSSDQPSIDMTDPHVAIDELNGRLYVSCIRNHSQVMVARRILSSTDAVTYSISGSTGAAGTTVALTGSKAATTISNGFGAYTFANLPAGGSYTVTPTKADSAFVPSNATFPNLDGNRSANFTTAVATSTFVTYSISGTVTMNGSPVGGVMIVLAGARLGSTMTAQDGTYSLQGLSSGDYTVTPVRTNFTFSPERYTEKLTGNKTINFSVSAANDALSINHKILRFGATGDGMATTAEQEIVVNVTDNLPVNWTVVSDKTWLRTTPSAGVGSGRLGVWLAPSSLPGPGIATANLTVSSSGATSPPLTIQVLLAVSSATGVPFGSFDTPVNGVTGLGSAVAVTGWALDDLEVKKVQIWRERVGAEPVHSNGLVYIADAMFVPNARPDVESLYPNHPLSYRAGWGYMMLTNFLPNPSGPVGNGTYRLHAIAIDAESHATDLGAKTITVDNAHWTKPFGAIDTPAQGGTVSGPAFLNSGWALTPPPNWILNGGVSAIQVYVDGVCIGHAAYNQYRGDVAAIFPGYANATGAGAYYSLDTTRYTNGIHNIGWLVSDSAGRTDGIGSRFFSILNNRSTMASIPVEEQVLKKQQVLQFARQSTRLIERPSVPSYRKGFNLDNPLASIPSGGSDLLSPIELDELDRVEIHLPSRPAGDQWTGGMRVNGESRHLPVGSILDDQDGVFYWQLGPGFLGEYQLEFRSTNELSAIPPVMITVRVLPARLMVQQP